MANPVLFLAQLNGSLAFQDRAGGGTLTGSGAVRYAPAEWARTNYVHNPRATTNTSYWTGSLSSFTRVTDGDFSGGTAFEVVSTAVVGSGFRTNGTESTWRMLKAAKTVSFDAKLISGTDEWRIYAVEYNAAGTLLSTALVGTFAPTTSVARFSATYTPTQTGVNHVHFGVSRNAATASTIRVSNVVVEEGTVTSPSYFDGSTGGVWLDPITGILGTAHASPSVSQAVAWVEEGTTNSVRDPIFGNATITTGWTTNGGGSVTLTRDTAYAWGPATASAKIVVDGSVSSQGIRVGNALIAASSGQTWSITFIVRGEGALQLQLQERSAANAFLANAATLNITATDAWVTYTLTGTLGNASTTQITPAVATQGSTAATFYVGYGGAEQKAYATSPCAGSLGTGYAWSGTAHASSSTRTAAYLRVSDDTYDVIRAARGAISGRFSVDYSTGANQYPWFIGNYVAGSGNSIRTQLFSLSINAAVRRSGTNYNIAAGSSVTVDTWYEFHQDWDEDEHGFAVNSGTRLTAAMPAAPDETWEGGSSSFTIGSYVSTGSSVINGYIGPVLIADRPLTAKERATLNANGTWTFRMLAKRDMLLLRR